MGPIAHGQVGLPLLCKCYGYTLTRYPNLSALSAIVRTLVKLEVSTKSDYEAI